MFKSWTVLLAILAFSGSLLGTFITRSGLLTSVHICQRSFKGFFILGILGISIGAPFCFMRCGAFDEGELRF